MKKVNQNETNNYNNVNSNIYLKVYIDVVKNK